MTIRKFETHIPQLAESAWADETAVIIGNVIIGADSSIWPGAVIRGDIHSIQIGERTSVQDNSVIHATHAGKYHPEGFKTIIGSNVTVGHGVILHGCTVKDYCLVGMGALILDGAIIEEDVFVGAGSLVPPGKILESGYLWVGSPVKRARPLTTEELEFIRYSANHYVQLKNRYRNDV